MNNANAQLSLVAFYGEKDNNPLWEKIDEIQSLIESDIADVYQRYPGNQIHGTIIGLEGAFYREKVISKNFKEIENREVELDLASIINYTLKTNLLPLTIRIGGYNNNDDEIFTSRGENPFNRTFSIQNEIIVAMGWPYREGNYVPVLDTLRRKLSRFGGLYKYHTQRNSYDNDFFFVLGNLKQPLEENRKNRLCSKILNVIASWKDTSVEIRKDNLGIIKYEDTKLEKAESIPLPDALKRIEDLKRCYPQFKYALNWLNSPAQE